MNLLSIIKQIEDDKRLKNIFPAHALYIPLVNECEKRGIARDDINNELRTLLNSGKIRAGRTINDTYIQSI